MYRLHITTRPVVALEQLADQNGEKHFIFERSVDSCFFACCVLMSWAGFWIKLTNAPARVALTLTTYLSVQTLRQAFILSIPKVPYLKLFDVWSIACESMIFASLVEFTLAQVCIYRL